MKPDPVTPGQFAEDRFGGQVGDEDVQELLAALGGVRKLNDAVAVVESTRASGKRPSPTDEFDSMDYEDTERRRFAYTVGRPPTPWEIAGPVTAGCHACNRLAQACDGHRRRLGSAIPLPPHPWPSDPGPDDGKHAPYSLIRSVG